MSIVTKILQREDWHLIEPVMRDVFQNGMPRNEKSSTFLAAMSSEKLAGFVHLEEVVHLNCVWVAQEYRQSNLLYRMMRETDLLTPKGFSSILLSDGDVPKLETLLTERFGARDLGMCRVFRKEY